MSNTVYVVTNVELGWDCVVAVFWDEKAAEEYAGGADGLVAF